MCLKKLRYEEGEAGAGAGAGAVRALYCLPEGFSSAGFSSAGFSPVVWVFSSGFIMLPALSEPEGFEVMLGSDGLEGLSEDIPVPEGEDMEPVPEGLEGLEGLMGAIPPPEGLEGLIGAIPPLEGALPLPLGSTGAPVLGVPVLGLP
jgi:hypothetical protein